MKKKNILSVMFVIGVWMSFKKPIINTVLGALGTIGIVINKTV